MLALVNGMDAVSYKQFWDLNVCFGYTIMLTNGCYIWLMGWML